MATTTRLVVLLMMMMMMMYTCFSYPLASCDPMDPRDEIPVYGQDMDSLQFNLNFEFLEEEFFCWSALGYGLDFIKPELTLGGPPPIGAQKANLDTQTENIIAEFCYQEVGHIRIIERTFGGFPRPLLDLSAENFAKMFDEAFEYPLDPPFNPYRDPLSYMLGSYVMPYMGIVSYVGTSTNLKGYWSRRQLAGLLSVISGQDAVIRHYLYERGAQVVEPYNLTVAEFTIKISQLRNQLAMCGIEDEGIIVPLELGAENKTMSNVLSANYNSLSYRRTSGEILRVVYNSGSEYIPGGFFPKGANGRIARQFLEQEELP